MVDNETYENAVILWEDLLRLAGADSTDPSLQAWLGRLKPVSFDGKTFMAAAQLKWTEQKIMTKYKGAIEGYLHTITLDNPSLYVVVDPNLFAEGVSSSTVPAIDPVTVAPAAPAFVDVPTSQTATTPASPVAPAADPTPVSQPVAATSAQPTIYSSEQPSPTLVDITPQSVTDEDVPVSPLPPVHLVPLEDYTFDTFVTGEGNKWAYDVARTAAEGNHVEQPIFFYSRPGLGKTHLLYAIYNYVRMYRPGVVPILAGANEFAEDYIDEIQNKKYRGKDVMKKYRQCDILLIDDVQFFINKQETVTTFFDIFNRLILEGKTIVLSADEPPDYLKLDDRMRTRFNQGTVLSIAPPPFELRRRILQSHYDRRRAQTSWLKNDLTSEQLDLIAEISPNSIRDMQGLLSRVMIEASAHQGGELSADAIRNIHDEMFRVGRLVEIPTIIKVVAKDYGVGEQEIRGSRRTKTVSEARQVSMWLARQLTDDSYSSIGRHFNRDHSTVYTAITKIDKISQNDRVFMKKLQGLEKLIKGR